jgi:Tfp pilus assembly protein PilV
MGYTPKQFKVSSRAFTLIEAVIAVVVLAIAVPPTLNMMDSASTGRIDAINTTRATFVSTVVLETVLADMTSSEDSLGFSALTDAQAYLTTPVTGLYNRLETILEPYTNADIAYTVTVGPLVSTDGNVSANLNENIFRTVTVLVEIPSTTQASITMPVSIMVSEL